MNISFFVRRDFHTIQAYEGIMAIKDHLIQHTALVVQDEDHNHLGILTPLDILQRPSNRVIDCLTTKATITLPCSVDEALQLMQKEQVEVLPVYLDEQFEGLVFKNDLLEFMRTRRKELELEIEAHMMEIGSINAQLEQSRQVLQAIFDSTQSYIFLVDPQFKIIFFNKKAQEGSRSMHGRELQLGDSILIYTESGNDEMALLTFRENYDKAVATRQTVVSEREIYYPSMMSSWIRSEYTPVYDNGTGILVGVALRIVDITERKRHEIQIEQQTEILQQISWMQSHQTRQPVATILGLINILEKSSLSDDNRKIVAMLEDTALKLDDVIRDTVIRANSI
jgi:PAS domain S-box-containing protein